MNTPRLYVVPPGTSTSHERERAQLMGQIAELKLALRMEQHRRREDFLNGFLCAAVLIGMLIFFMSLP